MKQNENRSLDRMITINFIWFCVLVLESILCMDSTHIDEEVFSMNELLLQKKRMKYIFLWTKPGADPMVYLGKGQESFLQKNCSMTNCYVTSDRCQNASISSYDMVMFHGPDIIKKHAELPTKRSPHQIYVFASKECPANQIICSSRLNNYFNWTWTYRLNSDLIFGYMIIKDKQGNVIGPKENMNWKKVEDMKPIDVSLINKLKHKRKAAAWFVSNCKARSHRILLAERLQYELGKHGLTLDVFGKCGRVLCKKDPKDLCAEIIDKKYYFYLAFENSFGEDYVSEKLLRALHHYAVPVVFGGANYTRFMPDGTYLNVRQLGVVNTVNKMVYLINNKEEYYKYFRWHNHYSYHDPEDFPETDPYCNLCAALNDEERLKLVTNYTNFDVWWNEGNECRRSSRF